MRSAGICDYAVLHKIYGAPTENETRYSPAKCIGCEMKQVNGQPDPKHVSTSFVERAGWSAKETRTVQEAYGIQCGLIWDAKRSI